MTPWYKNRIFIAAIILAVLLGGYFLVIGRSEEKDAGGDESAIEFNGLRAGEVSVDGVIACLPYYINVADQSCVKGLKGDDGKTYALNTIKVRGIENTMSEGTKVTAIGVYEPANKSVDEASVFSYDGVLVVRSLIRR